MSGSFLEDPVGDRVREHDIEMRRARWVNARDMVGYVCIAATIVGVVWAFAWTISSSRPRFSTGYTTVTANSTTSLPWCESRDERLCPIYSREGVAAR
jgi:hypothetical protein